MYFDPQASPIKMLLLYSDCGQSTKILPDLENPNIQNGLQICLFSSNTSKRHVYFIYYDQPTWPDLKHFVILLPLLSTFGPFFIRFYQRKS